MRDAVFLSSSTIKTGPVMLSKPPFGLLVGRPICMLSKKNPLLEKHIDKIPMNAYDIEILLFLEKVVREISLQLEIQKCIA
jgi:hypothetical protein